MIISSDHFKEFNILFGIIRLFIGIILGVRIIIRAKIYDDKIRYKRLEIPIYGLRFQRIVKFPIRLAHFFVVVRNKMRG
ncbi:hypothetical protein D3C76_1698320 [compost metagenome]